jgi:hypothetical protein
MKTESYKNIGFVTMSESMYFMHSYHVVRSGIVFYNYRHFHQPQCINKKISIHSAPHLLCFRALEVRKYVCVPQASHLRHPVNA